MLYRAFLLTVAVGALVGLGFAVTAFMNVSPTGSSTSAGPLARIVDAGIVGGLAGLGIALFVGLDRLFGWTRDAPSKPEVVSPEMMQRLEAAAADLRLKESTRAEAARRLREARDAAALND